MTQNLFLKPADKDSPFQDNHPKVLKYQLQYPVKSNKKALPVDIQTCFYWLIRLSRDESEFSVSLTLTKDDFVRLVWLVLWSLVRILSFQIQNELLVRMKCKSSQINVDYFLLVLILLPIQEARRQEIRRAWLKNRICYCRQSLSKQKNRFVKIEADLRRINLRFDDFFPSKNFVKPNSLASKIQFDELFPLRKSRQKKCFVRNSKLVAIWRIFSREFAAHFDLTRFFSIEIVTIFILRPINKNRIICLALKWNGTFSALLIAFDPRRVDWLLVDPEDFLLNPFQTLEYFQLQTWYAAFWIHMPHLLGRQR